MKIFAKALAGVALATTIGVASAAGPVTIRLASDTSGLPHPAAIAMYIFKDRVEEELPGSKVRIYVASSLYKIPEAVEAMTEGNLEMAWGQFGKTAQVDPYMNVVVGPMLLTTPGAINEIDNFDTFKMLGKRFDEVHDIKLFGSAHLSFYMGAGAKFRLLSPEDFAGKKIRSMGPAENAMLSAFGANPTTMAFGDVPPALETGVIDGLLTSLGGFNKVKDQAPFYSIAGINGIVGDYYWIGAANTWWNNLDAEQQNIISRIIIDEVLPWQKKANYCNDKRLIDKYGTSDPTKPGIYIMTSAEAKKLSDRLGSATSDWIKANTPKAADQWVDKFAMEAEVAVGKNPIGSSWLEKTDCKTMEPIWAKYTKKK
jgi:TRAP-type C4-dicarboxylate transport system substrate-binding protein